MLQVRFRLFLILAVVFLPSVSPNALAVGVSLEPDRLHVNKLANFECNSLNDIVVFSGVEIIGVPFSRRIGRALSVADVKRERDINQFRSPVDSDGDGVIDFDDNCPFDHNPNQEDSIVDGVGVGDVCRQAVRGDLNRDRKVNCIDFKIVRDSFGTKPKDNNWNTLADANDDGVIDARDLQIVARALPAGTVCQ